MPRTAFVTGATGCVGLNLVEELLAQGWRVIALHRRDSGLTYLRRPPAERAVGDVTDAPSVRRAMPQGVDAVFHVAGDTGLWSRNYARIVRHVAAGTLPGVPPGSLPFCHVREVARAHVASFAHGGLGDNYLLGGTDASFLELVREIGAAVGRQVPSRPTPAWVLRALGASGALQSRVTGRAPTLTPEAARMVTREVSCDSAKAMRELGYRAVPLGEMVRDCVAWLAAEGLLDGVESAGPAA